MRDSSGHLAMERKGKRPKGPERCCSMCGCLKLVRTILLLLATLMVLNIATGFHFTSPVLLEGIRRLCFQLCPSEVQPLFQPKERLHALYEKQCERPPHAFEDSYNKTIYSYANTDTDEARLKYALSEMLDERFTISFDRLLSRPRFAFMRGRFMLRLKTLAKNMRMGYDPRVMQGLVDNVKTHIDMHYHAINSSHVHFNQRYNSCVVVGNSGELLNVNTTRGAFIDGHDLVIRVNNAKGRQPVEVTRPLSDYIGSKTTLMFMNSHILHQCSRSRKCFCHPFGKEVPIVVYLCDVEHILDVAICGGEHTAPLFVTDRRLDLLVTKIARWYSIKIYFEFVGGQLASKWRQWEMLHDWEAKHKHEHHYSSGMQAVVLALGLCEYVDLVGFGKNPHFKHHFHTMQQFEHYAHDYEAEYAFYNDLENQRVNANPFLCEAGTYIPPLRVLH